MKRVKYLHIFWHDTVKFIGGFTKMINEEKEYFNSDEHYFITPHKAVYDIIKQYPNTELVKNGNLIKKYDKYADIIFVHALNIPKIRIIFTENSILNKTVWRTWGHDLKNSSYRFFPSESKKDRFFRSFFNVYYNAF